MLRTSRFLFRFGPPKIAAQLTLALLLSPAASAQTPFASFAGGNIVVTRVGDGSAALPAGGAAVPVFLDEYTPLGTLIGSTLMPTSLLSGGHARLTLSGSALAEGGLAFSPDGRFLTLAGYDAAIGTDNVDNSDASLVRRTVAVADIRNGTIDTRTALGDAYTKAGIRSAVTSDGADLWLAGSADGTIASNASAGIRYTTVGAETSTRLADTPLTVRRVGIAGGQLFASGGAGGFNGIGTVGVGLPIAPGQSVSLLPGFSGAAGFSPYDFFFADARTLYVAVDPTTGPGGGIEKWLWDAGAAQWTQMYTLNLGLTDGVRGLTGRVESGTAFLYALSGVTGSSTARTKLVTIPDPLTAASDPGVSFFTLATSPTNTAFRGAAYVFLPEPTGLALCLAGLATLGFPSWRRGNRPC